MATEKAERATTRNTIQRALVLEAVQSLNNHPTSADVYEWCARATPIFRVPRCTATSACWRTAGRCCGLKFPTAPTATISSTSRTTMRSAAYAAACSTSTCLSGRYRIAGFRCARLHHRASRDHFRRCVRPLQGQCRELIEPFCRAERVEIIVRVR